MVIIDGEGVVMYINNDLNYLKILADKEIYIFGAGNNGKTCMKRCKRAGLIVEGFIDNYKHGEMEGLPIIPLSEFDHVNDSNTFIIISSVYENDIRMQLLEQGVFNFISETQIDFGGGAEYYDEVYFSEQKKDGKIRANIKKSLFEPYISHDMTVIEFGSATGYLLNELDAQKKIGIEINDTARSFAKRELNIDMVKYVDEIDDEIADVIISTSVLEHVENPLLELRKLYKKLKTGGTIVFLVPNESCDTEYVKSEFNNHLYTWNCLNLGNLFKAAGFFVHSVKTIEEMWPKEYITLQENISDELFEELCLIRGKAYSEKRCLIVAYK